jgi:GT2 family glycosyltransferase
MKLSIIVSTHNRAHAIRGCLDSIAAALASAAPVEAEIVIVDNGSTDDTQQVIKAWTANCSFPVQLLCGPKPSRGLSHAHNRAFRAARGDLLAFTDDDCRLSKDYVTQLLSHDADDTDLVLRGGRIELGDPTDLPLTINTTPTLTRWRLSENSARRQSFFGKVNGCNMTMRRALMERIGPFDESFGPGARISAGGDTDYLFRAYLAGATIEYVPDMTVLHYHGRKTRSAGFKLFAGYMAANGALYVRYLFKGPELCRPLYWDIKSAVKELLTGSNLFHPDVGFSYKHKLAYSVAGAFKYLFMPKSRAMGQ